jgi:WS/DGAT/MGAT family acyltransferase
MEPRFPRLSNADLLNLTVEDRDAPMNMAAVLVLDGGALRDADGRLRFDDIRAEIGRRVTRVPRLRQVLHRPGWLAGRPLWIDDPEFHIARHVDLIELAPPGDERSLLRVCETLVTLRLDRRYPLWRIWLVAGLPEGRIAVVFLLHHVMGDGFTAIQLVTSLLGSAEAGRQPDGPPSAIAPPRWRDLAIDMVRTRMASIRRGARALSPSRLPRSLRTASSAVRRSGRVVGRSWRAPVTSLNAPIGPRRRLALVRLDLAEAKRVAHRYGGTVNDLLLDLAAGGLRALLLTRAEPVQGIRLHATVAVSLRRPGAAEADNQTGGMVVRLPIGEPDPGRRLSVVSVETDRAKRGQQFTVGNGLLVGLAGLGLARWFSRHQRLTNLMTSNVTGPTGPIRVLGADVLDVIPIGNLAGNLAVAVLAVSYAGRLTITVQADADLVPDLPVVTEAMRREWEHLTVAAAPDGRRSTPGGDGHVRRPAPATSLTSALTTRGS